MIETTVEYGTYISTVGVIFAILLTLPGLRIAITVLTQFAYELPTFGLPHEQRAELNSIVVNLSAYGDTLNPELMIGGLNLEKLRLKQHRARYRTYKLLECNAAIFQICATLLGLAVIWWILETRGKINLFWGTSTFDLVWFSAGFLAYVYVTYFFWAVYCRIRYRKLKPSYYPESLPKTRFRVLIFSGVWMIAYWMLYPNLDQDLYFWLAIVLFVIVQFGAIAVARVSGLKLHRHELELNHQTIARDDFHNSYWIELLLSFGIIFILNVIDFNFRDGFRFVFDQSINSNLLFCVIGLLTIPIGVGLFGFLRIATGNALFRYLLYFAPSESIKN